MNKDFLFSSLFYLSTYALLIPVAVSLYRYPYLRKETKVFAINLYIGLVFLAINVFSIEMLPTSRIMFFSYVTLDLVFQVWFFKVAIKNAVVRRLILPLAVGFLVYEVTDAFYLTGYKNYNSYCLAAQALLSAFLVLVLIGEIFRNTLIDSVFRYPLAWIAAGMLVNACTGVLSVFGQLFLSTSRFAFLQLNIVFSLGGLLAYVLYAIGFWQTRRT